MRVQAVRVQAVRVQAVRVQAVRVPWRPEAAPRAWMAGRRAAGRRATAGRVRACPGEGRKGESAWTTERILTGEGEVRPAWTAQKPARGAREGEERQRVPGRGEEGAPLPQEGEEQVQAPTASRGVEGPALATRTAVQAPGVGWRAAPGPQCAPRAAGEVHEPREAEEGEGEAPTFSEFRATSTNGFPWEESSRHKQPEASNASGRAAPVNGCQRVVDLDVSLSVHPVHRIGVNFKCVDLAHHGMAAICAGGSRKKK